MAAATLNLFSEVEVCAGLTLRNRVMRSATWEGIVTDEGYVTPTLTNKMAALAAGQVGLIITSHVFVEQIGKAGPWQLGIDDDAHIAGLRDMVNAVHKEGGKIGIQLAHSGRKCLSPPGVGPSNNPLSMAGNVMPECVPADEATLDRITQAFADAARRSKEAGFDCIQFHMAHGYLLSEWLSPLFNKRTDQHGGSLENRLRFPLRVVAAVRNVVGPAFPLMAKVNVSDFHPDGLTIEESTKVVLALSQAGVCLVEASGGTTVSKYYPIRSLKECTEGHHQEGAASWMDALKGTPTLVALVGGIRCAATAQALIDSRKCDVISMSRPFIKEPNLVMKWAASPSDAKASCISCSRCLEAAMAGKVLLCPLVKQ